MEKTTDLKMYQIFWLKIKLKWANSKSLGCLSQFPMYLASLISEELFYFKKTNYNQFFNKVNSRAVAQNLLSVALSANLACFLINLNQSIYKSRIRLAELIK